MDNKEEKTFADIFSTSTEKEENKDQTFSNVLKNENTKSEQSNNTDNKEITFDNLFEHIETEESESEHTNLETEKIDLETNIKAEEKNNTQELPPFNPFIIASEETKKKEQPTGNPFFVTPPSDSQENKELEQPKENLTNDSLFLENNNSNNPFFSQTTPINDTENIDINPFFNQENEKQTSKEELTKNPFLDNLSESSNKKTLEETTIEKNKEENNPFFMNNQKENNLPPTNLPSFEKSETSPITTPEDNPFFHNEDNNTVSNTNSEKTQQENKIEDEKTSNEEITDISKSTSPFFQEEANKIEENPLFQGQINLVENKIPDTPKTNIDITKSKHYDVKIIKKKEPLIKFILGVISYAIFIFLLLIGITLLIYVLDIKIRAAKGDYSSPTFNAYVVLTGSMLPEIQVYDVVITKKIEPSKLNEGDIITFASADSRFLGTIITHRIIKKNPSSGDEGYTFQTKGDNNNVADTALVPESNIYGKVILKIPKLGYLQEFLASDGGWIIVILIPCLTVISYDIVKLAKGLKRKKYKNIKVQK